MTVDDVDGEYAVLVLNGAEASIEHATGSATVTEPAVAIVPPGSSTVRVTAPGTIIRVLAAATAPSLAAGSVNAGDYETPLAPTAPGDYTFHLTGSIHGQAVAVSIAIPKSDVAQ